MLSALFTRFERQLDPLAPAEIVQPPRETWGFMRHFLDPIRGLLAGATLAAFAAASVELSLLVFLGRLVDWMAETGPETFLDTYGLALAGMAVVVLIVRPITVLLARSTVNLTLVPGLTNRVRWLSHRYVLRQSLAFFQNDFAGRISQKVMAAGMSLREIVMAVIDAAFYLLVYLVGTLVLTAGLDWRLMLPVFGWILGYAVIVWKLVPQVRLRSRRLSEENSALSGRIVDSYTNIPSVKLFAHASREEAFAEEGFARNTRAYRDLMRAIITMTLAVTVIGSAMIFAAAALAIGLWLEGAISLGAVALCVTLVLRINQMSGWILRNITHAFESVGTLQNAIETIARPNAVVDAGAADALHVSKGEIRFEDVTFAYGETRPAGETGRATEIIDHLNLTIAPGEKVGIVGRSGAGKSTLVNLLLRFYDVASGRILIDDQDIAVVRQESLRAEIGVVTQDTSLLHRSIRDNILYGRPDAGEEALEEAARLAAADAFIPDLKDARGRTGYEAHVGERGVKLSGGQRQRIAIARVLLKDAPILVLDEATSALDSEVEAAIQDNLTRLMEGKTVIAIAHRLSTIAALDRLIVMDEGRILEEGSHEELLAANGLYAQLWSRQSGGFLGLEKVAEAAE
ncbi:MAG: ABC transporter ATP-binding protein [Pseudomonadota bacterium]